MKQQEPYRLLFPLGTLFGLLGVGVWYLIGLGSTHAALVKVAHADIMMGGFLLVFSAGFLMTAVPKFSGTFPASKTEVNGTFAVTLALLTSTLISPSLFYTLAALLTSILILFAVRRLPKRTRGLPTNFVFVPLGLLCSLLGSLLLLLASFGFLIDFQAMGKLFFHYGMMHCLVLGVGSLLIPAILGFGPLPLSSIVLKEWKWGWLNVPYALATVLMLALIFESRVDTQIGRALRFVVVSFVALVCWRIHRFPKIRSTSAWFVWAAAWSVFVGNFLSLVFPLKTITAMHFTFIGGFSLLTLTVATRVVLAHGGHGLDDEKKSRNLILAGFSVLFATLFRVTADLYPQHHLALLMSAAIVWLFGFFVWTLRFLRLVLNFSGTEEHAATKNERHAK